MDLQLQNKAALVTGATAGIGLAIAQELAREGAAVTITGRAQDKIRRALDTIGNGAKGIVEVEREFFAKHRPASLLQRRIEAREIATTVAHLASPLSSATNGAAVRAEGGLLRSIA
jgi:3-oxoacyl-[acyl-carrier protein] reductase